MEIPREASITLAVLAGGKGSRMGFPKAEIRVDGQPVLRAPDEPDKLVRAENACDRAGRNADRGADPSIGKPSIRSNPKARCVVS